MGISNEYWLGPRARHTLMAPLCVNRPSGARSYETYGFSDRSHFTGVEPGWEQVADYALKWATSHARAPQG